MWFTHVAEHACMLESPENYSLKSKNFIKIKNTKFTLGSSDVSWYSDPHVSLQECKKTIQHLSQTIITFSYFSGFCKMLMILLNTNTVHLGQLWHKTFNSFNAFLSAAHWDPIV